ncbi:iron complex transport system substrate-binding protein [Variovorax sp. W2I14]
MRARKRRRGSCACRRRDNSGLLTPASMTSNALLQRQPLFFNATTAVRQIARAAAFVALGVGSAAHAASIRLEDDRGTTLELQAPARRIVSLMPSLTETVCALDACDRLVGVDRHANWPVSVKKLPQVGGMDDANIERIVALKPDLVLVRPRSRVAEPLERLGIKVLALDAKTHADMRRVMETVAHATGKPGAGEAVWRTLDARLNAARARVPLGWQGRRVYFEVHGGMAAASESSFIGETLARLGLANAVPGTLGPFPKMSPEFVVRADPDVLMVSALGEISSMASRPGWSAMSAIQRGRVCSFASARFDLMMRPGPRLDEAADAIVNCLASLGNPPR